MPAGAKHYRVHEPNTDSEWSEACRCTIGEDHDEDDELMSNYLSSSDAEDIWLSSGMDEDYDFR